MKRGIIFTLILLVFIPVCGFTYEVNVVSTSAPNTDDKKKYYLGSGLEEIDLRTLWYKKYENYVERALILGGFTRTHKLKDAELVIFTIDGGGGPGAADAAWFPEHLPKAIPKLTCLYFLQIRATVFGKEDLIDIWVTTAYIFTPASDPWSRKYLPVLATAVIPYLGSNTGKIIKIKLNANDKAVMEVKGLTNVN